MAIKLICLLFVILFIIKNSNGQKALADAACSPSCFWDDPTTWLDGIVPVPSDTVDFQLKKNYKVVVRTDVVVNDFEIGTDDKDDGSHGFEIASGASFRSTQVTGFKTATITINTNASITANDGSVQGKLIVYGTASFTGGTPSLRISTDSTQSPINPIFGTLELYNGTVVAANKLTVSSTSNIYGSGTINGTVTLEGTIDPGFESKIGDIIINGELQCSDKTEIHMDVGGLFNHDHIQISGRLTSKGDIFLNPINKFEPLAHSRFFIMNHTGLTGGFDRVRTDGWTNFFSKSWQVEPDQSYTAVIFDDASSVLISFSMIVACLLFTLV